MSRQMLSVLETIVADLGGDHSLDALAARMKGSKFSLQRQFVASLGESPKRYVSRVRLQLAAAKLVVTDDTVLDIALEHGFDSHEVFTRAFVRTFDLTPSKFRIQARAALDEGATTPGQPNAKRQADVVTAHAPCLTALRIDANPQRARPFTQTTRSPPMSTVTLETVAAQPTLSITKTIPVSGVATLLGEVLPAVFVYAQKSGAPMSGPPFARYLDVGLGTMTIQAGVPLSEAAPGEGEIESTELPAGEVATLMHQGPYDTLHLGHAALEEWAASENRTRAGAAWEVYVSDPGTTPDPKDWQTKLFLPLKTG